MAKRTSTSKRVSVKKVTAQGNSNHSRYNKKGQSKKKYRGQGK